MNRDELISAAKLKAQEHGLDPALVCAICEQESGWNPWAIRFEPAFYERYVKSLGLRPTEAYARSFSWGLMQVMGQVARERGYQPILSQLCDPWEGLEIGCRHFRAILDSKSGDVTAALQRWNGGGNPAYASEVLARGSRYA